METTATITVQEFDRGVLAFLKFLERAPQQVDQARLGRAKRDIEELRLEALAAEVRAKHPDIEIDYDLLRSVGIDEDIPIEDEMGYLASVLEEVYGYAGLD